MKTVQKSIPIAALFVALFGLSSAFADAGGAVQDATPFPLPSGWAGFAILAITVGSYLGRKLTRNAAGKIAAFLHSTWGATVTGLLGTVAPLLVQALQHGWNPSALSAAMIGGVLNFIAVDNASYSSSEQKDKVAAMRADVTTGPGPTITKASALIPFALALGSLFIGCAHMTPTTKAFDDNFGACMEKHGLLVAPDIGQEVWNDLTNGANKDTIVAQLETIAARASTDAVACAVSAWLNEPTPAEKNPNGVRAANAFLAKHAAHAKL